jgi:glycine/D-amino acid oxidase-like deaminating enzyme
MSLSVTSRLIYSSESLAGEDERSDVGGWRAYGFSGHGFQTGPGVGDVMAELIATRETSIAIDHYSIKRFLSQSAEQAPEKFGP